MKFDLAKKRIGREEAYTVFRFPVLPEYGSNTDLSFGQNSNDYVDLVNKEVSSEWSPYNVYLHGMCAERAFGIMSDGGMRSSVVNIKQQVQGVYGVDPLTHWKTAVNYCTAVPLTNNGIYYQFVAELRAPSENVKHNRAMGSDYVLEPSRTRVIAFRFYAIHCREWRAGDGLFFRQAWDPYLEYHPTGTVNTVPEPSNLEATSSSALQKVREYMKTLAVPVCTEAEGE